MDPVTLPNYLTATGNVGPALGGQISSVTLTPAAALSTLVIRESGSTGPVICALQAGANGASTQARLSCVYAGQLHATLTGASASALIEQ